MLSADQDSGLLGIALSAAVPLWIERIRDLPDDRRLELAREASQVIASQGDTLMFGSTHKMGHGEKQIRACRSRPRCAEKDCRCKGEGCTDKSCWCHVQGEPAYSAGEVFSKLASGLAAAAFQPGGITFSGQHWCTDHDACRAAENA